MDVVGVFEQGLFEQPAEGGAQPRGGRFRQHDAVPAHIGVGEHRDDGRRLRQLPGRALPLGAEQQAVGAGDVKVVDTEVGHSRPRTAGVQALTRGNLDNEGRHGFGRAGVGAL